MAARVSRLLRSEPAIILAFAGLAVVFSLPVYAHPDYWGIQDWDMFLLRSSVSRASILEYGQFPLWNPFTVGGMPHLAQPETNLLSLPFLVELLFGVILGNKLNITLHLFIGLGGTYFLARHFRQEVPAALLAAFVFMFSGMYAVTVTEGMVSGYAIAYMPWALLFFLRALESFVWTFAAVLVLTMMWLAGGIYPFCLTFLLLALYALLGATGRDLEWKPAAKVLASVVVLTFLLGAVKFLPAIEFTAQYQRQSEIYSGLSLEALVYGLFGRDQSLAAILDKSDVEGLLCGFTHGMGEIGMYVGVLPVMFFLVALFWGGRRYRSLALCVVLFVWLALGHRSAPLDLWALVHRIPPYSIMRTAERFRYVFMLGLALLAGAGLQLLADFLRRRFPARAWAGWAAPVVVVLVLVDLVTVNSPVLRDAFAIPPLQVEVSPSFVQTAGWPSYDQDGFVVDRNGDPIYQSFGAAYPAFLAGVGTIFAYESMPVPDKALPVSSPAYRGEVYLAGSDGHAAYRFWSPNRLVVEVESAAPGLLVINQNHYPGWRVKDGQSVEAHQGLLAVRVEPGSRLVEFYYLPTSVVVGALLSLITLIGMACWYRVLCRPADTPAGQGEVA